MKLITLVLAILEAVPILDRWYQEAVLEYTKRKVLKNDLEFVRALAKAQGNGDTLDLQRSFNSVLDD
jgi:hypothetical protein